MQIAVLGAGAMGGTIAALLDRAGHDLEVTARGAGLEAIREHGIRLSGAWGEHIARVAAGEALTRVPELAIVATKAMDAAAAVAANAGLLRGVPVVVWQNGLGGIEAVQQLLPDTPVIGALSLIAATYRSPGDVVVTAPAGTWLGMLEGDTAPAHAAAAVLGEALPVTVVEGFAGARWTKLIINQVNALPAITDFSVQEVVAHDGLRRIMALSMREAVRIALADGVRFEEVNGVTHEMLEGIADAEPAASEALPRFIADYLGKVPNPGSTLQSIRRGQLSEIDSLNGAIVAEAHRIGRQAPINARLVELVHQVEASGRFLTAEETLSAVAV
ncbi:MAG: 2-dehydropantoate 2-reductase [Salinibacterium sp.]|nr:2-dehydropantoate 2-reductase [Salinibacterium sp.]MBF0672835.1 2-dehydropantoate 2-reductase [Salinibacterium sp.]